MQKLEYKKSAVDLTDLALGIIVLGVVVSIGATILFNYRDSRVTSLDTASVVNESATATDGGDALAQTYFKSVTSVVNATGGQLVQPANYSTSLDTATGTGTLTFNGASSYNGSSVKVTYDYYNLSSPEYALSNNASVGLGEYGNWFTIIVIVGVASVILSLIFMAFGGNRGQSSSMNY